MPKDRDPEAQAESGQRTTARSALPARPSESLQSPNSNAPDRRADIPSDRSPNGKSETSSSLRESLKDALPQLVELATGSANPETATRLLSLLDRIEARDELDEAERARAAKALEYVRQAERMSADAIRERAMRVIELALVSDAAQLDGWVRRMRIAAGKARPEATQGGLRDRPTGPGRTG